jgi:hypothetical protein
MALDELVSDGMSGFIREKGELAEVFDNFDDDTINDLTRMTKVDKNTNISETEIKCMSQMTELRRLGLFDNDMQIDNTIKILNISKNGWGRQGKIDVAVADRNAKLDKRGGMFGGLSKLFTPRSE